MDYAFIIDTDHIATPGGTPGTNQNATGMVIPRNPNVGLATLLGNPTCGRKFRLYDDDGELYYSGRIVTEDGTPADECFEGIAFAPLDDFGMPNAGTTEIRYLTGGEWVQL